MVGYQGVFHLVPGKRELVSSILKRAVLKLVVVAIEHGRDLYNREATLLHRSSLIARRTLGGNGIWGPTASVVLVCRRREGGDRSIWPDEVCRCCGAPPLPNMKHRRCARCRVYYCSEECQAQDWKEYHRAECASV